MKNLTFCLLALAAFSIISCDGPFHKRITGNGVVGKETRNPGNFSEVKVNGSPDVILHEGNSCEVTVEAEENILRYIRTRVKGDLLIVDLEDNINITTHEKMVVHITAPRYKELTVAGSGNIQSEDKLENPGSISFVTAGSGDIEAAVNTPELNCRIAGSGNISITGETQNQDISIAGNGDINNEELRSENTKIKIAGSGNARVHASVKLNIEVAGSGDVFYRGSPTITQKVIGSGEVKKID